MTMKVSHGHFRRGVPGTGCLAHPQHTWHSLHVGGEGAMNLSHHKWAEISEITRYGVLETIQLSHEKMGNNRCCSR